MREQFALFETAQFRQRAGVIARRQSRREQGVHFALKSLGAARMLNPVELNQRQPFGMRQQQIAEDWRAAQQGDEQALGILRELFQLGGRGGGKRIEETPRANWIGGCLDSLCHSDFFM